MSKNQKHEKFTYAHLYGVVPKPATDFPRKTLAEELTDRLERQELELEDVTQDLQDTTQELQALQDQLQKVSGEKRLLEQLLDGQTVEDMIVDITDADELVLVQAKVREQATVIAKHLKDNEQEVLPALEDIYNRDRYAGDQFAKNTAKERPLMPSKFSNLYYELKQRQGSPTGVARVKQVVLAARVGEDRSNVNKKLLQMEAGKMIYVFRNGKIGKDGKPVQTQNVYRVNHPDFWDMEVLNMGTKKWWKENRRGAKTT